MIPHIWQWLLAHLLITHKGVSWADAALVAVQLFGLLFIIFQIRELQKSLHSATHSSIYSHYAETVKLLLDHPHLYGYLREGLRLDDTTNGLGPESAATRRAEVRTICELTTTLFEHAWVEQKNMPAETWASCWLPYIRTSYERSSELSDFYWEHRHFYVEGYRNLIEKEFRLKR